MSRDRIQLVYYYISRDYLLLKKDLEMRLGDMNLFAKTIGIKPFDLYLIAGSASVLGNYSDKGTRNFDFIDLNYSSELGRVFRILGTFGFLDYESTILSPSYQKKINRILKYY